MTPTVGSPDQNGGPPTVGDDDLAAGLAVAVDRLAVVASASPDVDVPTCPGWTVRRLAVHTGRIHRWVADALAAPAGTDVPPAARPDPGADLGAWLADGAAMLAHAFAVAGPAGAVQVPGWERSAGWWRRRTCHETLVHAWDAQAAAGIPDPLDPALARDGIDEVIDVFLPTAFDLDAFGADATLHLHTTDPTSASEGTGRGGSGGEWLITVGAAGVGSERRHAKGDVALRAPASELLLWLWGRRPTAALDVVGDATVAERFGAATRY